MNARVIAAAAISASSPPALAVTGISRFDLGAEAWTVDGPGTIEWVSGGGDGGGCIKVTRTGPGEVYLVAPASFRELNCAATQNRPHVCLSARADRSTIRPLQAEIQTSAGSTLVTIGMEYCRPSGGGGCWSRSGGNELVNGAVQYLGLRIRVGVDPSLPVGEVMSFDNIQFRTAMANCDGSTAVPTLTANDFQCFLNAYAAQDPYGNLDAGTSSPVFTANDFQAFLIYYASNVGCP